MASYAEVGSTPLQRYFPKSEVCGIFTWHEHLTGLLMLVVSSIDIPVIAVEFLVRPDPRKKKFIVQERQPIARLKFGDGTETVVQSKVNGEIVAFNHRLKDDLSLINEDPQGTGHLLYILPRGPFLKRKELSTPPES